MTKNSRKHFLYWLVLAIAILSVSCSHQNGNPNLFETSVWLQKSDLGEPNYIYVPFSVPANTKSISINYEYDKKDGKNQVDLGVFDNRFSGGEEDKKGFRGWSGVVRQFIFIAAESATHGYDPGNISPGKWTVILGLKSIEKSGVYVNLKIRFDEIDTKAKQQFDEENQREFSFTKNQRVERLETNDLTWFAGDLHTHTFDSDGRWSVKGILESARSNNLDFVSITDHNTFSHHADIEKEAGAFPNILVLRGEEVTTNGGHINVWGLPKGEWIDFRVTPNVEESAKKVAAEAEKFGALASINHPFMDCAGCRWSYGKWGNLEAVEIWNGKWDEQDQIALTEWDKLLLNGVKITGIASSDSHQRPEEKSDYPINLAIGEPTIFVGAKDKTLAAILDGIRNRKVFVADNSRRGIMLTADESATIGDTIEVPWGDTIAFKYTLSNFENGSKFWLVANGQVAKEYLIDDQKYTGEYNIYARQDGYVRLEVRNDRNEMLGFSNPIFFRVKYPDQPSEDDSK